MKSKRPDPIPGSAAHPGRSPGYNQTPSAASANRPERPGSGSERAGLSPLRSADRDWLDQGDEERAAIARQKLMNIERRQARARVITMTIPVLLIMLLTVFLIISVMKKIKPKPQFIFVQASTLTHTIEGQALLIRDETVYEAPGNGLLKTLATEGSRVSRSQKLALIIPDGQSARLKELQKCEQDIIELQAELMNQGKGTGARAIYDESSVALTSIVNLIRSDVVRGQLVSLPAYTHSMNVILEQRSSKLQAINFNDARLDQLFASRASLEKSLGLAANTLTCQAPGIVSFKLDQLEDDLKLKTASKLTYEQYQTYLELAKNAVPMQTTVKKDDPVLRITASRTQDLAIFLPGVSQNDFEKEGQRTILVPQDGTSISHCTVVKAVTAQDGLFVIFSTDRKIEWFADRRVLPVELVLSETSGLKVPMASLINYDPDLASASIMIVDGGYTTLCSVHIRDHDREYAIIEATTPKVSNVKDSSILVANPESIEPGEFIGNEN